MVDEEELIENCSELGGRVEEVDNRPVCVIEEPEELRGAIDDIGQVMYGLGFNDAKWEAIHEENKFAKIVESIETSKMRSKEMKEELSKIGYRRPEKLKLKVKEHLEKLDEVGKFR